MNKMPVYQKIKQNVLN